MFVPFIKHLEDREEIIKEYARLKLKTLRMSTAQKIALATHYMPHLIPFMLDVSSEPTPVIDYVYSISSEIIGLKKEERINYIREYKASHPDLSREDEVVLGVIENLEEFEKLVFQHEDVFSKILQA